MRFRVLLLMMIVVNPFSYSSIHAQPAACEITTPPSSTLDDATSQFADACPDMQRRDCDEMSSGVWQCSTNIIGANAPEPDVAIEADETVEIETDEPVESETPVDPVSSVRGQLGADDLLVLHYDNCPDRDDGHAMAAAYSVVETNGLMPLVVNGTCGNAYENNYVADSEAVAGSIFPSQLNALTSTAAAVDESATAWAAVLANDADVWVAEGGASDFTAKVLREISNQSPELDRSRIHIVQHSTTNEGWTDDENLEFVKESTDYIRIEDGNDSNATADLNQLSDGFVSAAKASRFAGAWNAAFDYLNPFERLDFSDSVELLYIIGDSDIRNPDDFAEVYLE